MPFHNSVYYPYQTEPLGGQSSVGIPSLLNSPQSQRSSGASAMSGMPVFKFRARREAVDWRRISAVDVDRIASELDCQTLQEHVMGVTFCSVEHERCPYCQNPVDPVLLKLFRLAQLTIEYLLHSQDFLTQNLQATEERLQASAQEKEQLLTQIQKQALDAKGLKEELKQRKKIIASQQQSMVNAGMGGYYKCRCCDKAFMNDSFLQSHMQRRHPEEYDIRLMSEKQKVQAVKLQDEIDKLKDQLNLTRSQLEMQQQAALKASQVQEQQSKEDGMLKRLERWKEEERERLSQQMREMFLKESNDLKTELLQYKTQVKHLSELEESSRNFRSQQEEQLQASSEERHRDDVRKLQQLLKKQDEKWVARFQKSQDEHERERNKLQGDIRRLQSATEEQEASRRRLEEEMSWKVQEQRELISSQREQMRQLSVNPPVRGAEPTVIVAAPEPKPRPPVTVQIEQPKSVGILEPITELTEEEKDSPSVSERKPEVRRQPPISALKKDPGLKRQLRLALEQTLVEKLESLGIREGVNRLTKEEYSSAMAKLRSERDRRAKKFPDYGRLRDELSRTVTLKARERDAEGGSTPEQLSRAKRPSDEVTQTRSRSGSPPSRITQAAPRTKSSTLPKSSTPRAVESESSEEESEEEGPSPRQGPSWGQSAQPMNRGVARSVVTKAMAAESDSEWSDGSIVEEIDPRQLQRYGEQNGTMGKASKGLYVKDLRQSLEKQLQDRSQRRPPGGVALLPANKEAVREAVQELKYAEIDEDDDDDWDISSLEDKPSVPKQDGVVALKKSHDSSTSVWGSSTGKGQDAGAQKGGTSSTLKSSVMTVSDWSDDDI
ncbi:hypothetical protein GJAV_G00206980 [Gymnothorax javanicus]|nr:hypothetical protein GJAV_G00206980 [Gymnothorax javanicus]